LPAYCCTNKTKIRTNKKIAISNDGKVVALSSSSQIDISKGRIYVYELSYNQAPSTWNRLGLSSEIIVGLSNDDQFGWDLALSSDGRVVAGSSIASDESGINNGQVRLFELSNNTNRWLQKGFAINGERGQRFESPTSRVFEGKCRKELLVISRRKRMESRGSFSSG
jgi:hypothetical protein